MVKKGTFEKRLDILSARVGHGTLTGTFWVDQRYAAYEHVHHDQHDRPGLPEFVSVPLGARHRLWFTEMARLLLRDGAVKGMVDGMEDMVNQLFVSSPEWFGNLRRSGNYRVVDAGKVVADVPAAVPRLPKGYRGPRFGGANR